MPAFSARDFSEFNGLLAAGVERGVSLEPALELLADQARSGRVGDALRRVMAGLREGKPIEQALHAAAGAVPDEYPALVASGVASNSLAAVLRQVESHHALLARVRERAARFAMYLAIGGVLGLAVLAFLAVPVGEAIRESQDLHSTYGIRPAPDWDGMQWLRDHHRGVLLGLGGLLLGALGMLLGALRWLSRRGIGYWLPVWGPLFRSRDLALFCSVAAMRLRGGAAVPAALEAAAAASPNRRARRELEAAKARAVDGAALSDALYYRRWFPRTLAWAVSVAERRGDLPDVMDGFARIFQAELDRRFEVVFLLLTPLGMLALGNLVFAVALLVFVPLLGMIGMVSR